MKLSILGGGAWGTALAVTLSQKHVVTWWVRSTQQAEKMKNERRNHQYLPHYQLPASINIQHHLEQAIRQASLIILATPVVGFRETLQSLKALNHPLPPLLWACKGFEAKSGLLPHAILLETLPTHTQYGLLCGPSFAEEVAKGLPTAIVIASKDKVFACETARSLSHQRLRCYANTDLIGAEIGAAAKNVIAIATGVVDGLALGLNARSALITRGLAEISMLIAAMGGHPKTLSGLSGIGDLILTCTGALSRNRQFGLKIAQGATTQEILSNTKHVVEGIQTTYEIKKLATQYQLDMPITEAVYNLLEGRMSANDMVACLMERETKLEFGNIPDAE